MNENLSELKQLEEAKRERNWDAKKRWLVLQATIDWAQAQATVKRNTPAARKQEEREKLAGKRLAKRAEPDVGPTNDSSEKAS